MTPAECREKVRLMFVELYPHCTVIYSYPNSVRPPLPYVVLDFERIDQVGSFERIEDGKLSVAKVTFGAEPKDYEVQEYIQKHYASLKFSLAVDAVVKDIKRNPKRMQREARRQMQETGIGTKSQQALKLQQKQNKQECKIRSREKKEAEELRMFEMKQQKKREKHKGH